jgi:hypothetical protein
MSWHTYWDLRWLAAGVAIVFVAGMAVGYWITKRWG